ncbi:MAG: hypothetical protein LBK66_10185 [Spirochaetaceae bacterium]|nr:hypothetical protein [Spirochaetaceae bacterium]
MKEEGRRKKEKVRGKKLTISNEQLTMRNEDKNEGGGGSTLIVKRQKPLSIDKFFFTAPPRSKGFCFAKTLFRYPHSWGNEPPAGGKTLNTVSRPAAQTRQALAARR